MPRRKSMEVASVQDGEEERQEQQAPEAVTASWPDVTPVYEVTPVAEPAPERRIVKEAMAQTMWLIENGVRRPITSSAKAAALGIRPEVVSPAELQRWTIGDAY